jgi:VWFA-related protein
MGIGRFLQIALIGTVAIAAATAVWSQQSASNDASQAPLYHSTTRAVVLDAVVIGPDGNPATGLQQSDFHLLEDGALQDIQYFRSPMAEVAASGKPAGRTVLLVDELNSKFKDLGYAELSVHKLLDHSGRLAEPTALMVLTGNGVKVIQDYTQDGAALLNALHTHRDDMTQSLLIKTMTYGQMVNVTLGALSQLSDANLSSDMRQTIVWITPGLEPSAVIPVYGMDEVNDFTPALKQISNIMLRSRTVLYAVDPQGVGMGRTIPFTPVYSIADSAVSAGSNPAATPAPGPAAASYAGFVQAASLSDPSGLSNVALGTLTHATGGRYFFGRNDVDAEISKSMAMGNSAYMLSYTPTDRKYDGSYRKIVVTVDRPGCTVVTRPGYFSFPEPTRQSEQLAKYQIDHAVTSRLEYSGLTVKVAPGKVAGRNEQIALSVDPRGLRWDRRADGNYESDISIIAVTFDSKGKALYSVKRSMRGQITAAQFEASRDKPWEIALNVPVDPKQKRIRVVVRDAQSGQVGTAETAALTTAGGS